MKKLAAIKTKLGYMFFSVLCLTFAVSPTAFARPIGSIGSWNTSPNSLPTNGSAAGATVTYNGYAYVLGGDTNSGRLNTIYYAKLNTDGTTGTWATNAINLPNPIIVEGAVVANGYMYIIGGFTTYFQSTVSYAKINADGSVGAWITSAHDLPQIESRAATVYNNGYIYVMGGATDNGTSSAIYYTKVNVDGSIGAWTTSSVSLPAVLQDAASFVSNGYVYVLGGQGNSGKVSAVLYAKLNSDGSLGSWTTNVSSLPQALVYHVAATSNGYAYVAGGRNSSNSIQSTVYYAKINTDGSIGVWTTSSNNLPEAREASTSAVYGGYLYILGGQYNGTVKTTAYSTQLGFVSSGTVAAASSGKLITVSLPTGTNIINSASAPIDTTANSADFNYPLDLVSFTFTTDVIDNQISLDFPTTLRPDQVVARKYNPTTKTYITIPGAVVTQTTVSGEPALHVTYSIADGSPLDEDGAINGTIVDPVTLAIPASATSTLTNTGTSTAFSTIFSASIVILATTVFWTRRQDNQQLHQP